MNIGIIGIGNMGGAIARGIAASEKASGNVLILKGRDPEKTRKQAEELGAETALTDEELVRRSDIFFIGVEPKTYGEVLAGIREAYAPDKICVSMAAGISLSDLEEAIGKDAKIIRIMPNTPAKIGKGMTSISRNACCRDEDVEAVKKLLECFGRAGEVTEDQIGSVIAASGSSPAYTFLYIKALAQSAVNNGMDPESARLFAAQAVLGAAELVLRSEDDFDVLVDQVATEGGATIESIKLLKGENFEDLVVRGAQAAVDKANRMGAKK